MTKRLDPKYTKARLTASRHEVYDSERDTWLPLWIALGYMNHAEMVEQIGWDGGAETYCTPEVDGAFDGGGGE
jgi:hypothetical protein